MLKPKTCPFRYEIVFCDGLCAQCKIHKLGIQLYQEQSQQYTQQINKPPLGIMPKHIHDEQRQEELKEAINRYFEANKPIPIEWVEEYNELAGDK